MATAERQRARDSNRIRSSASLPSSLLLFVSLVTLLGVPASAWLPTTASLLTRNAPLFSSATPEQDPPRRRSSKSKRQQQRPPAPQPSNVTASDATEERISQLEQLVAKQAIEILRLQQECRDLTEAAASFARVVEILREAGLQDDEPKKVTQSPVDDESTSIFGEAPSSVLEAADSAGAALLASLLAGHQRLLVDVRDAELFPDMLVQFLELAVLPVAAGLEGLNTTRNRLKLVFPTVSQMLLYRRSMALAAPDVVALSTLGLEPVEEQDNLVVFVAPEPGDTQGWANLEQVLNSGITQPVIVIHPHMSQVPPSLADFTMAYHLRLLSVQYTSASAEEPLASQNATAFETALAHAHQSSGSMTGQTRAMVIRAFPKPWHVFVDVSPDTDADFAIAATFEYAPTSEEVNLAIVECLEGSEREDELVAQQMQEALESGQLDRISEMWDRFEDIDDEEDEDDDDLWTHFRSDSV